MVAKGSPSASKLQFREQLGLRADGPLVLSGHQADLWHCGILAKHFASLAVRDRLQRDGRTSARCAWLVVDQDEAGRRGLRIPVRDTGGALRDSWWAFAVERDDGLARTGAGMPAIDVMEWRAKPGERAAHACISDGIAATRSALNDARATSESWAEQASRAAGSLIRPVAESPNFIYESRISGTDFFRKIIDALSSCGTEFLRTYNASCRGVPDAGLRPLDESRGELPLWEVVGGNRRRLFLSDLGKKDPASLAPRALLMTAIMRAAGCELFVHGTGGGIYDRATEAWVRAWPVPLASILGEMGGALAPMVVATADVQLPLADAGLPDEADIARAVWLAHHARHDPALLGDFEAAKEKATLVQRIAERRRAGEHPVAEFGAMQALLRRMRTSKEAMLQQFTQSGVAFAAKRSESKRANDRSWSFALHPVASLGALRDAFAAAFAGS